MVKILITGGHLTPALAVIDFIRSYRKDWQVIFVGREVAQAQTGQRTREKQSLQQRGLEFIDFMAPKTGNWNPGTILQATQQASKIIATTGPSVILTFGGYLGVPFALAAAKTKTPVITHEQTRVLGRANRLIGALARYVAVSYPEMKTPFGRKTQYTGNPIRPELFNTKAKAPTWFKSSDYKLPWLYLAGGSQGCQVLNRQLLTVLDRLAPDYVIIHQHGADSAGYQPAAEIKNSLLENQWQFPHYYHRPYLTAEELAYFYPRLSLAVSRAGANTVTEFTSFRLPAVYVPLPHANYQEQTLNAQALVDQGAALLLPQTDLEPLTLLENIYRLTDERVDFVTALEKIPVDQDASERVVKLIELALQKKVSREVLPAPKKHSPLMPKLARAWHQGTKWLNLPEAPATPKKKPARSRLKAS